MGQTPLGLTYPESGDHTRLWEHFQTLAQDVDTLLGAIGQIQAGEGSVNLNNAAQGSVAVTFPTPFPGTPIILASSGNSAYTSSVTGQTANGCNLNCVHIQYDLATRTVPIRWIAIYQP